MGEHWGTDVVPGEYAGHPGLLFEPRPRSLVRVLDDADRFGERVFLVQGDQRVTFGAFRRAVAAAAAELRRQGVAEGDRVLLLAYNSPAWVLSLWAVWVAGAVPVLGNRWWSAEERADALALVEPASVITDDRRFVEEVPVIAIEVMAEHLQAGGPEPDLRRTELPDEDADAMILFTSGSSGRAKAVRLTHRSVLANQHNLLARSKRLPHQQTAEQPQTVALVTVPLFHIGGVTNLVTQVIAGGRLVFLRNRFDPAEVLQLIESEQVTTWGGVPTMARRVIEHADFEHYDLRSLRSFPLGGAPVPDVLLERLRQRMPHLARGLAATWGLSESGGFLTLATAKDLADHPGTSGRPHPVVEVRVLDPDHDGEGELLVRSPTVMAGYVNHDDDTVDAEGWLHTGDLGRYVDGHVYVTGRVKDMVIRAGENIACPHVESVLLRHPDVVEAAVLGIPHADLGEELAATVVTRRGASLTAGELREHALAHLAYFEVPSQWRVQSEPLPVLATGKVDKHHLRAEHVQERPADPATM